MAAIVERPRYRPQRHPGRRGRWTRTEILRALRAWQQEVGHPPRRRDWSGEEPECASRAQRKWMREHPRWPSSSCVAGHFGSWSAALEAAALPARRLTFPTTVGERVRAARELAGAGWSATAIAGELGVSRASVHNYLAARDCPDCDEPITNPYATVCGDCRRHVPTVVRTWTREDALTAIRDWSEEHGRPPRYREWTPSRQRPGRWEAESPRWPSAALVCALFADEPGPWRAALAAAAED